MSTHRLPATLACMFLFLYAGAQSLYEVPLDQKIRESTLIIEGRVLSEQSFWNPAHTMIYTAHSVEVYKVFKGEPATGVVDVLTMGGVVDDRFMIASDLLTLRNGDAGIFFCEPAAARYTGRAANTYTVYSSAQGVFKYDLGEGRASAPYVRFSDIRGEVYPALIPAGGRAYRDLKPSFRVEDHLTRNTNRFEAPSISSFAPATVTAGKRSDPSTNQLVINGSGFGTGSGAAAVLFDDPDDGTGGTPTTVPYNDECIMSWSNTQIVLRVPSSVGTGTFSVRDAGGVTAASPTPLDVSYAIINLNFSGAPFSRMLSLFNYNDAGGYDFAYSSGTGGGGRSFAGSAEEAAFSRALNTWKQMVGLNYNFAGTTPSQAQDEGDGENIIMFDNASTGNPPLPAGVLAVCYSSGGSCGTSPYAYRLDFDIVVRNSGVSTGSTYFNNGPCATRIDTVAQIDMESVLLHELGHALNLGHINDGYKGTALPQIDPQKVMNFAIVNGVDRRSPDWSALQGARFCVNPKGIGGECGVTEMIPLATTIEARDECPSGFPSSPTQLNTSVSFDLAHASSNRFVDPQFTRVNASGTGTGITNNAWFPIRTNANGGTLNLAVTGYTTDPAAQAICATQGVELSLYNVSSCPAGQAFPTPVAYRTFNGNGSITSIAGLTPNTNYLIMLDGISNTKALFTLGMVGTALPARLLRFEGRKQNGGSLLSWSSSSEENLLTYELEVSRNGAEWVSLGQLRAVGGDQPQDYEFPDGNPASGLNAYRLRMTDADGRISFSDLVNLLYRDLPLVSVFPNPVLSEIRLAFSREVSVLEVRLYGIDGKLLLQERRTGVGRSAVLNSGRLSPGLYQLETLVDGERITSRIIKR